MEDHVNYNIFYISIQNYIARFGHGSAKLARQAQSKEKTLAKMVAQGLTEKVIDDKILNFYFPSCGKVPPPVIMVQVSHYHFIRQDKKHSLVLMYLEIEKLDSQIVINVNYKPPH